jgi:hypothetical protein
MHADGIKWDISVWHMYGQDPEPPFKFLAQFKHPIWVTEFNHPRGSESGLQQQADGLKRWMLRLRELQATYNVEAAHIYELLDETYWAPNFEAVMGLVRLVPDGRGGWRTGEPKPAYHTVKEVIRGTAAIPTVTRKCDLAALERSKWDARTQVSYVYCLILDRVPDGRGFAEWVTAINQGMAPARMALLMVGSDEFRGKYATFGLSSRDFAILGYRLLLGRDPDGGGLANYVPRLESGTLSHEQFLTELVDSDEFRTRHPVLFAAASGVPESASTRERRAPIRPQ